MIDEGLCVLPLFLFEKYQLSLFDVVFVTPPRESCSYLCKAVVSSDDPRSELSFSRLVRVSCQCNYENDGIDILKCVDRHLISTASSVSISVHCHKSISLTSKSLISLLHGICLTVPCEVILPFGTVSFLNSSSSVFCISSSTNISITLHTVQEEEEECNEYIPMRYMLEEYVSLDERYNDSLNRIGSSPPKGILLHGISSSKSSLSLLPRSIHISDPKMLHNISGDVCIHGIDTLGDGNENISLLRRVIDKSRNVSIVCTAENSSDVDSSLRRAGRIDREVDVDEMWNVDEKEKKLRLITENYVSNNVSLREVAERSIGFLGGDLEVLCEEAHDFARICGKNRVEMEHFDHSFSVVVPSVRRGRAGFIHKESIHGLTQVGGCSDAKRKMSRVLEWPLLHKDAFSRLNVTSSKGILLYGPPGCAKTSLVRMFASKCKVNLLSVSGAEVYSSYVGESENIVRDLFKSARQNSPCVLFLDEIDALVGKRKESVSVSETVLSTLLNEMDGVGECRGVVVVGATNCPWNVDEALLRPGRFDELVYVGLPDGEERLGILEIYMKDIPTSSDVSLVQLAHRTHHWSGADLQHLCRDASLCALREECSVVCNRHFEESFLTVSSSVDDYMEEKYMEFV